MSRSYSGGRCRTACHTGGIDTDVFGLQEEDFDVGKLHLSLKDARCGCVVHFVGTVRDDDNEGRVKGMAFEAYEELALPVMREMADEAKERFGVTGVAIVHRTGGLSVGDNIVFVGVSAPHRKQGFSAICWLMDELKQRLPVWKKELLQDGSRWVGGESNE
ncbi:MAG: hypothetical protein CVT48_00440 [Thermoplasmata archaeon HGW-Thermoplasmata-1]|nr:MAG: hypothetical protein CVT48_00440 [Thermoplasmata archaeon HGW-Thermoplasmata-1]